MSMLRRGSGRRRNTAVATALAVALASTVLWSGAAPAAVPCSSPPQTFPTSQMTRGMHGTGYTVIQGDTLVPFDVEILGVLPNAIFLGIDVVAAKITGPAAFVNVTGGAIAGMSGSPVYINGRLAGAVAWAIAGDRQIFGMTAAEDMVHMFSLQDVDASSLVPERVPLTAEVRRAAGAAGSTLAADATLEALPLPLGVSGLNGIPLSRVERSFSRHGIGVVPFRAGAVAAPSATTIDPSRFAPGDGLGVALSYGDVSYYGFGTTTAVCGDVAIGFGHPLFWGLGRVSLGMNDVDVLAVDNTVFWGSKIGTLGALHGELTQDRFAGVAGVFGQLPHLVGVTSSMSSPDTGLSRDGETQIAWDQDWFVADAATNHAWSNLTYVQQQDGPGTLRFAWTIEGTREDGSPFVVSNRLMQYDRGSASSGVWRMGDALYQLAFNEWEDIEFTGVDMTAEVTEANLTSRIARVRLSSPLQPSLKARSVVRAKPGQAVTVEVTFDPVDGDDVVATFRIKVPRRASGLERVRLAGPKGRYRGVEAGSLDELIWALGQGPHGNDLTVTGLGASRVLPQKVIVRGSAGFAVKVV
jgi:hypothetical protein